MKVARKYFLSLLIIIIFASVSFGQNIVLTQSNESGIYEKAEIIQVRVHLKELEADSLSIKILKNNTDIIIDHNVKYHGGEILIFNDSINESASLIFEVRTNQEFASLGSVVDPDNFKPGFKRPEDFGKYWEKEKKDLRSLFMNVKRVPVDNIEKGYLCSDIEINSTGPKPARGYFAKPEGAKPKSLPIVLSVHAAGVSGSWCLAKPEMAMANGQWLMQR